MVLVNNIWIQVNDFEDLSNAIREYYNEDLADVLDNLIKKNEIMISEFEEKKRNIASRNR